MEGSPDCCGKDTLVNTYILTHTAQCPNGNVTDRYRITLQSETMIEVERIREVIRTAPVKIYQEALADYLCERLGCLVRVHGVHLGVRVISERE